MIFLIFVEIFHDIGWLFATRIRIRLTKMKRIQTNPDPKHCFWGYYGFWLLRFFITAKIESDQNDMGFCYILLKTFIWS